MNKLTKILIEFETYIHTLGVEGIDRAQASESIKKVLREFGEKHKFKDVSGVDAITLSDLDNFIQEEL